MRSVVAIALILAAGIASLWLLGARHAHRMAASSSQIFIHGTPVCVTQRGGEIEAVVGECGSVAGNPRGNSERFHGATPLPGNRHRGLPPGHPPVDEDLSPGYEAKRRLLI
ncbi:MAG TPA: hypothetical protein VF847_06475 [Candidatus Deferrimicrobiaceae bacterium]